MVSARAPSDIAKFDTYCTRTETLNEWITTVRYKKSIIRRQRKNRDLLRVAALNAAILKAELELKRKQNERSQKWAQLRSQYMSQGEIAGPPSPPSPPPENVPENDAEEDNEESAEAAAEAVAQLWSSDLMGLNNFFNDLSQIKTVVSR